jgi:hypothetical protein
MASALLPVQTCWECSPRNQLIFHLVLFQEARMLSIERTVTGHSSRLTVVRDEIGWEVREERDGALVRVSHRDDWHRVERLVELFKLAPLAPSSPHSH